MEAPEYYYGGSLFATQNCVAEKGVKGEEGNFEVEDLLVFSNEEEDENGIVGVGEGLAGNSAGSSGVTNVDSCNDSVSGGDQHFSGEAVADDTRLAADICEPYDQQAELEWLSNFVEESFSSEDLQKLQLITGTIHKSTSSSEITRDSSRDNNNNNDHTGGNLTSRFLNEKSTVPGKARSKRSRAAPNNWSSRLLVLTEKSTTSSPPATSSSDSDTFLPYPTEIRKPFPKIKKRETSSSSSSERVGHFAPSDGRKCLHCQTDKTPQWRTGPMGPKTLCNACGVRYKSGRLVPEYRPAASPTFVLSKHSNSHRKVLELRRQKEVMQIGHHHHQPFVHDGRVYDGGASVADDYLIHHHLGPDYRQLI